MLMLVDETSDHDRFQPLNVELSLVAKMRLTKLLVLLTLAGSWTPSLWPPTTRLPYVEPPQVFAIKVVPLPSMIVTESMQDVPSSSTSNAVNSSVRLDPSCTWIIWVWATSFG